MKERILNDIDKPLASYRAVQWIFPIVVIAAMLVPLFGMLWAPTNSTEENRDLAEAPKLVGESGGLNVEFLQQAGCYFTDHYAYKSYLVDADARLFTSVFGFSTAENVVFGDDGWLYYAGTLSDYQDRAPLRQRQAYAIAHNVRMLQDWCEAQGSSFAFTVAPNKNTLYPESMPSMYPEVEDQSMAMLKEQLERQGVNYVDMFDVFNLKEGSENSVADADTVQYFLRDSHWSDRGALLAHDALADSLDAKTMGLTDGDLFSRDDYIGDLNLMLFPISATPETDWYARGVNDGSGASGTQRSGSFWDYEQGSDPNDGVVVTSITAENPFSEEAVANGRMLMFRDSFAIGLLPYFASENISVTFDKMVPYNALQLLGGDFDSVVVERAQRHVKDLADDAFIMPCPLVDIVETGAEEAEDSAAPVDGLQATCEIQHEGDLIKLAGCITGYVGDDAKGAHLSPDDNVYIRVRDDSGNVGTYEAFLLNGEADECDAYAAYIGSAAWADRALSVKVLIGSPESVRVVGDFGYET